jgi:cellobiose-specific phosphotransferase system component IIA
MKWLFKLLGVDPLNRKRNKLKQLKEKAFEAQRNGNLRLAGKYLNEAEFLETEIIQEERDNEGR